MMESMCVLDLSMNIAMAGVPNSTSSTSPLAAAWLMQVLSDAFTISEKLGKFEGEGNMVLHARTRSCAAALQSLQMRSSLIQHLYLLLHHACHAI